MPREAAEFATMAVKEPRVWTPRVRGTCIALANTVQSIAALPIILVGIVFLDFVATEVGGIFPVYSLALLLAAIPLTFGICLGLHGVFSRLLFPLMGMHRFLVRKSRFIAPEALRRPLAFPGELTLSPRITTGWIAKMDDGDDIGAFVVSVEGLAFHGDRVTMHAPFGAISSIEVRSMGWKHFWAGRQLEVILRTAEGDQRIIARAFGEWSAASGDKAFRAFMEVLVSYRGMARMVHG